MAVTTTSLNEALDETLDETKEWHQMKKTSRFQRKKTERIIMHSWLITAKYISVTMIAANGVYITLRGYKMNNNTIKKREAVGNKQY